jgi:hypothetical protein
MAGREESGAVEVAGGIGAARHGGGVDPEKDGIGGEGEKREPE